MRCVAPLVRLASGSFRHAKTSRHACCMLHGAITSVRNIENKQTLYFPSLSPPLYTMPRYRDEWIIDRVLFEYVSGDSCSCCGLEYQRFLFQTTPDLIHTVSDLDMAQKTTEIQSLAAHPWPPELRDQVWSDRVKIRQKCKLSMPTYREFWSQHGPSLTEWLLRRSEEKTQWRTLQRSLQMSRSELLQIIQEQYKVHSAYSLVLTAVLEQLAHFPMTAYGMDSCAEDAAEVAFEKNLQFHRLQGGFTLPILFDSEEEDATIIRYDVVQALLDRMQSLGGPKLLHRPGRDEDADDARDAPASPSFQSDRRLVRWILARYWADRVMEQFRAECLSSKESCDVEPNAAATTR